MNKPAFIKVPVDQKTLEAIDHVVAHSGKDRASFAADVLRRIAEEESRFLASLEEAERQIDRGEYYTQQEVEAWFAARRGTAGTE